MSVHIRVVTPVVPTGLTHASDFEGILGPEDHVSFVELDYGPASIECDFDEALATPGTVERIIEAEADGVDAIVLDCMEDPGLRPGREAVSIPVLGPCETTMHLACSLGHRFSVLAVLDTMRSLFANRARLYGAAAKYASTRSVEIPVRDLDASPSRLSDELLRQAKRAVLEDDADSIILGCTGMKGVAQRLQDDLAAAGLIVPVLDPIPVTIRMAKLLVETGLGHSKRAYPTPAKRMFQGYARSPLDKFREPDHG